MNSGDIKRAFASIINNVALFKSSPDLGKLAIVMAKIMKKSDKFKRDIIITKSSLDRTRTRTRTRSRSPVRRDRDRDRSRSPVRRDRDRDRTPGAKMPTKPHTLVVAARYKIDLLRMIRESNFYSITQLPDKTIKEIHLTSAGVAYLNIERVQEYGVRHSKYMIFILNLMIHHSVISIDADISKVAETDEFLNIANKLMVLIGDQYQYVFKCKSVQCLNPAPMQLNSCGTLCKLCTN